VRESYLPEISELSETLETLEISKNSQISEKPKKPREKHRRFSRGASKSSLLNLALSCSVVMTAAGATIYATTTAALANAYSAAKEQFDKADYKGAAATLRAAMYKGAENNAPSWLLLARSYAKLGETGACRQTVAIISKYFPGSKEAKEAETLAGSFAQSGAGTGTGTGTGAATASQTSPVSVSNSGGQSAKQTAALEDRITTIAPRFGHAPVDRRTTAIVRDVVKKLPTNIYKILDRGGAQIFVTPNLIDKFPDAVQAKHPTLGHYLSEEFGRTYGKDIYISERVSSDPGATDLQAPLHEETIRATAYTQLSHALDCCLEMLSKDPQYLKLYRQDVADCENSGSDDLKLYLSKDENGAKETFSGLVAGMMGANTHITRLLESNFPRAKAWIKARIELLSK